MKKHFNLILVFFVVVFSISCNNKPQEKEEQPEIEVKKGSFYGTDFNSSNAVVLADTITYDVTIKNPDPEDNWTEDDIGRMDEEALANIVINAIYNGRLTAYNYSTNEPMTIEQVKELESEYSRDRVGRMRFIEEWYFDEEKLEFGKRVNTIMLAYEKLNSEGIARYIPGVMVYLTDKSKNPTKNNIE